jgi:NAD(P)-dependent dehydrogenase (short-subunit alcohol dehydrogenase family)
MSKQVALITGSNTGFGRLTLNTLAQAGHTVFASMRGVNGKNAEAATRIQEEARAKNWDVHILDLDVTQESSVNSAVQQLIDKAGRIDVLVNNAGFGVAGVQEAFTIEQVQSIFEVNVFGVLRANRAVLPFMRKQGSGLLINISSGLGRIVLPFTGPYTASKFALEALSENARYELKSFGVDSVIIEPGAYPTDFGKNVLIPADYTRLTEYGELADGATKMFGAMHERMKDNPPKPQDIADIVLKLVETPFGERPLRIESGGDVSGAKMINEVSAKVQDFLLQMLGM